MEKFVVTAKLGDDYFDSTVVEAGDIAYALNEACDVLNCSSYSIISIMRIT